MRFVQNGFVGEVQSCSNEGPPNTKAYSVARVKALAK